MSNLQENSSTDPFTLVFCGLWDMLENSQQLVGLVAPPNRIKWLGAKVDPRKDQQTDSDRPEIRVDPGNPFAVPDVISGTSFLRCQWDFVMATDKQPLDRPGYKGLGASMFPVMFALYQSLLGYTQQIKALQYNGNCFVSKVQPGEPYISIDNQRQQQGLIGWTAVWPYKTWLYLNTLVNLPAAVS